jgi:hypothetical protein
MIHHASDLKIISTLTTGFFEVLVPMYQTTSSHSSENCDMNQHKFLSFTVTGNITELTNGGMRALN